MDYQSINYWYLQLNPEKVTARWIFKYLFEQVNLHKTIVSPQRCYVSNEINCEGCGFANRFVIKNDKISEYHIYVDASAVLGVAPSA